MIEPGVGFGVRSDGSGRTCLKCGSSSGQVRVENVRVKRGPSSREKCPGEVRVEFALKRPGQVRVKFAVRE